MLIFFFENSISCLVNDYFIHAPIMSFISVESIEVRAKSCLNRHNTRIIGTLRIETSNLKRSTFVSLKSTSPNQPHKYIF